MRCLALLVALAATLGACTTAGVPGSIVYAPKTGRAPAVIVLSGSSGLSHNATKAAYGYPAAGYYTEAIDGRDVFYGGRATLEAAIARARRAPGALPDRVAVVGYSMGGGAALAFATSMPETVSTVIVYYPMTDLRYQVKTMDDDVTSLAGRIQVPTLFLQAENDRYLGCCTIETARAIEAAARARNAPFTLVVYPGAEHAYNYSDNDPGLGAYSGAATRDSWERTLAMLHKHHPIPSGSAR